MTLMRMSEDRVFEVLILVSEVEQAILHIARETELRHYEDTLISEDPGWKRGVRRLLKKGIKEGLINTKDFLKLLKSKENTLYGANEMSLMDVTIDEPVEFSIDEVLPAFLMRRGGLSNRAWISDDLIEHYRWNIKGVLDEYKEEWFFYPEPQW